MTRQTEFANSLGGSPAGSSMSRLCNLTLAAISGYRRRNRSALGQTQPDAAKPATTSG